MPQEPIGDDPTQPLANAPERNNREYVPATWAPAGGGSGHPKVSGGFEQSRHRGGAAPRGYNRPDQRYALSETELQSRRTARAATEITGSVVLIAAGGAYGVRTAEGNNYDCLVPVTGVGQCNCADYLRLQQSGKLSVECKHIGMVRIRLTSGPPLEWSTSYVAEVIGCDTRTVEQLCHLGTITATLINNWWSIPTGTVQQDQITAYRADIIGPMPDISAIATVVPTTRQRAG